MNGNSQSDPPSGGSSPADNSLDEGRKYWKAAIAHLAPEKREAAWEFYLDRLESSAAADTLGGVMLLLEAHLAFFDDLPARLRLAAQEVETASRPPGQQNAGGAWPPAGTRQGDASPPRRRWSPFLVAGASAALGGGIAVCVTLLVLQHRGVSVHPDAPAGDRRFLFPRASSIRAASWNDPTTHRQRGAVVTFGSIAWTERTSSGGANIYVPSPVEEVRRDLEALRQATE